MRIFNRVYGWRKITLISAVAVWALLLSLKMIAEHNLAAKSDVGPRGLHQLESLTLGGVEQWVQIRTRDTHNPVLLILHGGPGMPEMPLARHFDQGLEQKFIVVHWDQRGAGKSASLFLEDHEFRVEKYLDDTATLIQWIKQRFGVEKIFLMGHSFGSYLGAHMAARHAADLYAYVGVSQIYNVLAGERLSWRYVFEAATRAGNQEDIATLKKIGEPPYASLVKIARQRMLLNKYGGGILHGTHRQHPLPYFAGLIFASPEYSLWDVVQVALGAFRSAGALMQTLFEVDMAREVPEIKVPVYLISGVHDYNVPWELAARYASQLRAPYKEFIPFEHSAHAPNYEESGRFSSELSRIRDKYAPSNGTS